MVAKLSKLASFTVALSCIAVPTLTFPYTAVAEDSPVESTTKLVTAAEAGQLAVKQSSSALKAGLRLESAAAKRRASDASSGPSVSIAANKASGSAVAGSVGLQVGYSTAKRALSRLEYTKADLDNRQSMLAVALQVRSAYREVLKARAQLAMAQEAAKISGDMYVPIARLKRAQGTLTQAGLNKVLDDLTSAKLDTASRQASLDRALEQLGRATGTATEAWAAAQLEGPNPDEPLPGDGLAGLQELALSHRVDLQKAQLTVRQLESSLTSTKWGSAPTLSLSANGQNISAALSARVSPVDLAPSATLTVTSADQAPTTTEPQLRLGLNWTVFDAGSRKAQVAGAKADLDVAKIDLEDAKLAAISAVTSAYSTYQAARQQLGLSRSSLEAAEDSAKVAGMQVTQGSGSQLAARESGLALLRAQSAALDAECAVAAARDSLIDAVGVDERP